MNKSGVHGYRCGLGICDSGLMLDKHRDPEGEGGASGPLVVRIDGEVVVILSAGCVSSSLEWRQGCEKVNRQGMARMCLHAMFEQLGGK